jgi:kinesin family protein 6/9
MAGDPHNYPHRGIIPRALQHVFREADLRSDRIYTVAVSYLEIYNETLRDLLAEDPAASDSLAILDDAATTVVRHCVLASSHFCDVQHI